MAQLEVNTDAIRKNYSFYRDRCGGSIVIPVMKDNAYGLGARHTVKELRSLGVDLIACATPEEATDLLNTGCHVLLLSCIHNKSELYDLIREGVILSVESFEQAKLIDSYGIPAFVHVAVDTGFGRFGFLPDEADEIRQLFALPNIKVCGIFSHISSPVEASSQKQRFDHVLRELDGCGLGLKHLAASSTALNPDMQYDAVRIGSGLTGRVGAHGQNDDLISASKLTARICNIRLLPRGSRIGYSRHKLRRDTTVAIIDAGVSDGAFIKRSFSLLQYMTEFDEVDIMGFNAPLLGNPGLTHTAVDITNIPCKIGDRVVIDQTPVLVPWNVKRVYV